MCLVKDESWAPDIDDEIAAEPVYSQVSALPLNRHAEISPGEREASGNAGRPFRAFADAWFRSIRLRLLLGPIVGPVIACTILIGLGDSETPGWMMTIFAGATLLGIWITAIVVGQALKPLDDLAEAANRLGIGGGAVLLPEDGSNEASVAAKAFNAMSERVNQQVAERVRLLSAFSHDMQTPITRMRLRVELADEFPERDKLLRDLHEAERLVRDGIAYARNSHLTGERDAIVDLKAFIESIVFDYEDTGRDVSFSGRIEGTEKIKPRALRRIMSNFIDNALKFAGAAEIRVLQNEDGRTVIAVMDRGPGIAEDKLDIVMKPFVRLPNDVGESVPGVGLGLAIAQQLAREMDAVLVLENRQGGGLSAQIVFTRR